MATSVASEVHPGANHAELPKNFEQGDVEERLLGLGDPIGLKRLLLTISPITFIVAVPAVLRDNPSFDWTEPLRTSTETDHAPSGRAACGRPAGTTTCNVAPPTMSPLSRGSRVTSSRAPISSSNGPPD